MKTSCGKFLNLAHYFPYDVELRLLAQSRSFLANQKAGNAIVAAENLLKHDICTRLIPTGRVKVKKTWEVRILGKKSLDNKSLIRHFDV